MLSLSLLSVVCGDVVSDEVGVEVEEVEGASGVVEREEEREGSMNPPRDLQESVRSAHHLLD